MTDPRKPLLRTPSGTVSGSVATTADGAGVAVFRAVPVAHTAHFGAPEPPAPWSGVLDCTDTAERRGLRLPTTVSVFAPVDAGTATALPVIAWIHGGRYEEGHGDDGWYDGTTLAAAGCVVVTLNYRMCLEGFLPLDDDAPGSFRGVDDLVHALEWVRDTVPDLGGDPGNVTLFGQSAGGGLVMTLLTDRRADTLFHRAVVLSPGLPRILPRIGWTLRRAVARVCLGSRLTHARVSRLSVARCRRAYRRMAAVYASDCALGPGPVPLDDLREVPLLVSTMQDEFVRFPGVSQLDRAAHRLRLPAAVMTPGMLLLGVPWRNLPRWWGHVDADRPMGRTVGDTMILRWAAGLLEKAPGDDVWACEFRGGPWRDGRIDAQHCGELPMFFDTLTVGTRQVRQMCGPDAVERLSGLGGQVRDVLLGFARGGDPGWGRWSDGRATRVFDLTGGPGTTAHDPLHAVRTLLPVRD